MHSPSGAPGRTQTSRRSLVRREKFASLVAAREFQRPSPSRRGKRAARGWPGRPARPARTFTSTVVTGGAAFQPLFGVENRKPTIAQWSVFLPRLGRARRQASPPILSCRGLRGRANCGCSCGSSALFDNGAISFLYLVKAPPAGVRVVSLRQQARPRGRRIRAGSESARRRPPDDQGLPPRVTGRLPGDGA